MLIFPHKHAMRTPRRGNDLGERRASVGRAERYGTSKQTVWKWRKRVSVYDRSHTAHRLQTTLTPTQEVVALRKSDQRRRRAMLFRTSDT